MGDDVIRTGLGDDASTRVGEKVVEEIDFVAHLIELVAVFADDMLMHILLFLEQHSTEITCQDGHG